MAKTKPALGPQARAALRLVRGQRDPWSYRLAVAPPDLPPGEAVLIHSYRRLTAGVLRALIAEGEELKETLRVDALHDALDAIDPPTKPVRRPGADWSLCSLCRPAKYWTACGRIRPGRMDGQETGSADNPDVKEKRNMTSRIIVVLAVAFVAVFGVAADAEAQFTRGERCREPGCAWHVYRLTMPDNSLCIRLPGCGTGFPQ